MAQISIERAFELAAAQYRAGRAAEAEAIYRQILSQIPNHVVAMHQLGILLGRQRRAGEAVEVLQRLVQHLPESAEAHIDFGNALRDAGRLNEAAAELSRGVEIKPALALGHGNLANVMRDLGRLDEAIAGFQRAIQLDPNYAEAYSNLGNALCDKGRLEDALAAFRQAIRLNPAFALAYSNLGVVLEHLKRSDEAVAAFRRAIEIEPNFPGAWSNLGQSLESLGRVDEAIEAYERAIRIDPNFAGAYCNLGNALFNKKRIAEAIAADLRAIQLAPGMAEAYNNLGNARCEAGEVERGLADYRHAMRLRPDYADAMNNLAAALIHEGKLDEPEGLLLRAIEVAPEFSDGHWNLAIFRLLHGDFERGLPEYEWRWKVKGVLKGSTIFAEPQWDGGELNGRTILLHAEQGFGDAIHFVRYVPMVAARGGRIILQCAQPLKRLFGTVPGVERIVDSTERPGGFEVHCPFVSLALAFGTRLDSIPADVPYLRADEAPAGTWKKRILDCGSGRRIGLAWSGAGMHSNDRNRSTVLANFAPLATVKDAIFFSLQKGEAGKQAADAGMVVNDFTAELHDFADTAALIENLDLVITVDTSVAHLAGAMGKPVWVLLPCNPDWRWMYDRLDSPWYPTMRLFRHARPQDWPALLTTVARELADTGKFG